MMTSPPRKGRGWRRLGRIVLAFVVLILVGAIWFAIDVYIPAPLADGEEAKLPDRTTTADGRYHVGNNWLGKDTAGLYEVYIAGADLERGLAYGSLAKELIVHQEEVFIDRIQAMIPGKGKLTYLKYFSAWFDRDIDEYIPREYLREIYGVSRAFSDEFDAVGPKFVRALNYHAAHDIGHALQDLAIVGCTSFAAWGDRTADDQLLIARNFDFWMGEEFARDKLITFINPDGGIPHVLVSWGGFMGATSAMNLEGVTVTINASRSSIPMGARMPISLLAREIVEHAKNIEEAIAIARQHEVFVSESILIGSAADGKAVIIEKAPDGMDVFDPDNGLVVCSNHYQSKRFGSTEVNEANKRESDSMARYERMMQLVDSTAKLDPTNAVRILRDRKGPGGSDVGLGDPSTINQLLAHHAVVMQPEQRRIWVSNAPYQEGAFVCYDLRHVFERCIKGSVVGALKDTAYTIAEDPFIHSDEFAAHDRWLRVRMAITERLLTGNSFTLDTAEERQFIADNPNSWLTYAALGDLRAAEEDNVSATSMYKKTLTFPISSLQEEMKIKRKLELCSTEK
ncbi:MAG: acyl-CoA--6-aminopenicillanic acid acyl-transferase [Flavobacteriales bacterium]|nr:acyl-CoA--6-aminopenicillanic acid acyl-transferase [Flavobacteriales bacterium]